MKFVCTVCDYTFEGEKAPDKCPIYQAPASKFIVKEQNSGKLSFVDEQVKAGLKEHF